MTPEESVTACDDLIADLIEFLLNYESGIDDPYADDEAPGDDRTDDDQANDKACTEVI